MLVYESAGTFRLWHYTVSHTSLLIRGHTPDSEQNIDLMFLDVPYLNIPTTFEGIQIIKGDAAEAERLTALLNLGETVHPDLCYSLVTGGKRYGIVATYFRTETNTLPDDQTHLY